jgi:EAL and modified HD-GYP domain-containing signal transduction protein
MLAGFPGFINLTENLLRSGIVKMLPKERVVLEILEDVSVDAALVAQVQELVRQGYRIALDDFVWADHWAPLVKVATYIKLDVQALTTEELRRNLAAVRPYGTKLVAEKVESAEQMQRCKRLGFHYFQGFHLAKPRRISGRRVPTSRLGLVQLLARIHDPKIGLRELNRLISRDVGLSFRFLRIVNSAYYNLPGKVESIQHALTLLGLEFTRMWVSLIALASIDDQPREVFVTAAVRAKMCELLARQSGQTRVEPYYVCGLFSILDLLLDAPLPEILSDLPLDDDVVRALVDRAGLLGQALACVEAHEQCRWDDVVFANLDASAIQRSYLEALAWASETQQHIAA